MFITIKSLIEIFRIGIVSTFVKTNPGKRLDDPNI